MRGTAYGFVSLFAIIALQTNAQTTLRFHPTGQLINHDQQPHDNFGNSISIGRDVIAVGADCHDEPYDHNLQTNEYHGAAYTFTRNALGVPDGWWEAQKLQTSSDPSYVEYFGYVVATDGETVVASLSEIPPDIVGVFDRSMAWAETQQIAMGYDQFVEALAVNGNRLVIGTTWYSPAGPNYGEVLLFEFDGLNWAEIKRFSPPNGLASQGFGLSVAIHSATLAIGDSWAGKTYIYERNGGGTADDWGLVRELTAGGPVAIEGETVVAGNFVFARNQGGADQWGQVTQLSAGGSIAMSHDRIAATLGSDVRLFEQNHGGVADSWGLAQTLPGVGENVELSGDVVVAGPFNTGTAMEVSVWTACRSAGVLLDQWPRVVDATGSDSLHHDRFGKYVAVSGDFAVVGAPLHDGGGGSRSGAAYVLRRNTAGTADAWGEVAKLTAGASAAANAEFGRAVAISGDTIIIGAPFQSNFVGAAYVFVRNHGGPDQWGLLKELSSPAGPAARFGHAVAVSDDVAIVGAPLYSGSDLHRGAAFAFERNAAGVADGWGQVAQLESVQGAAGDHFGASVAMDGDDVIIGAPWSNGTSVRVGAAYTFARHRWGPDQWGQLAAMWGSGRDDQFGHSVAIDGGTILVGAPLYDLGGLSDVGAVYVFDGPVRQLVGTSSGDRFGWSVAIQDNLAAVGADGHDDGGLADFGEVYLYERNEGGADQWGRTHSLPGTQAGARFGRSVGISGASLIVGSVRGETAGATTGRIAVFRRDCL